MSDPVTYTGVLPVAASTEGYLAHLLAGERARRGTRRGHDVTCTRAHPGRLDRFAEFIDHDHAVLVGAGSPSCRDPAGPRPPLGSTAWGLVLVAACCCRFASGITRASASSSTAHRELDSLARLSQDES